MKGFTHDGSRDISNDPSHGKGFCAAYELLCLGLGGVSVMRRRIG